MPKRKTQQVGGRKEAQLAIVEGSVAEQTLQKQVYTPEDAEFHYYSTLLTGFFEKISRWKDVARTQGYTYHDNSQFSVFRSDNWSIIAPGTALSDQFIREKQPNPQYRILDVDIMVFERPSSFFPEEYPTDIGVSIEPGEAGKHLFTDLEGKPLEDVGITIYDKKNWDVSEAGTGKVYTGLKIRASYPSHLYPTVRCEYKLHKPTQTLIISQTMPEAYQTHLFDTIDCLIPRSTPIPQNEHRKMQSF